MKIYRIVAGHFIAGIGEALLLTAAQAEPRRHNLEPFAVPDAFKATGAAVVTPKALLEFKAGEAIGVENVPKAYAANLVEITDAKKGTPEYALLASAEKVNDAAKRAADERDRTLAQGERERLAAEQTAREQGWKDAWAKSPEIKEKFPKLADYIAAMSKPAE